MPNAGCGERTERKEDSLILYVFVGAFDSGGTKDTVVVAVEDAVSYLDPGEISNNNMTL